ncbi:MAG TPA: hypothetical protein PK129_09100 [Cellvibrionaceae bacterium]|nr:hypothetical protein [Cellvibrionaceae bacterium]
MKTLELIRTPEAQLVLALKEMKLKELEKHGQNLVRLLGGEDYRLALRSVIKLLPSLSQEPTARFEALTQALAPLLPKACEQADLLAKLSIILTLVVRLKFTAIHENR